MLKISSSIDSSTRATQTAAKYDEVDGVKSSASSKLVKKLLKSRTIDKSLKNLKDLKSRKVHWFKEMFTKVLMLSQLDITSNSFLSSFC